MAKKHNRLKKAAILLLVGLVVTPIFSVLILQRQASAIADLGGGGGGGAPAQTKFFSNDPREMLSVRFKTFVALATLYQCVRVDVSGHPKNSDYDNFTNTTFWQEESNVVVSKEVEPQDGVIDCDENGGQNGDMHKLAELLGFPGAQQLNEFIWPNNPPDMHIQTGNGDQFSQRWVNGHPGSREEIVGALAAKLRDEGRITPEDAEHLSQANPAIYTPVLRWEYYNTAFVTPESSGGCGGQYHTENAADDAPDRAWAKLDTKHRDSNDFHGYDAPDISKPNDIAHYNFVSIGNTNDNFLEDEDSGWKAGNLVLGLNIQLEDIVVGGGHNCAFAARVASSHAKEAAAYLRQVCDQVKCNSTDTAANDPNKSPITVLPGADVKQDVCEATGFSLSWLICPVFNQIDHFLGWVKDQFVDLLRIEDDRNLKTGDNSGMYGVWAQFRLIANVMFVIIALIIIISQALSLEIVSAYTAKKALPRLLIGVIAVQFSWLICVYLVKFVNQLGADVEGLIYQPFGGSGALTVALSDGSAGLGVALSAAAGISIAVLGAFAILLPVALAGLMAVLTGFFVLVIRQAVLYLLIAVSPLAYAAFVLPHTQKMFKLWWDFFWKGLLMYPMIIALIAFGRVFGHLMGGTGAGGANDQGSFFRSILGFISVYAPYFMLPLTFKFAGGLIGNLGGMVNDRSRGLVDRAKKRRDAQMAKNWEDFKMGDRRGMPAGLNTVGRHIGAGYHGRFGFGEGGQDVMNSISQAAAAKRAQDPLFAGNAMHDDLMNRALKEGNREDALADIEAFMMIKLKPKIDSGELTEDQARSQAQAAALKATNKAERVMGFSKATQIQAAKQLLLNKTGYHDAADVAKSIAKVAGGDEDLENSLRGFHNAYAKQLGRNDIADISSDDISVARQAIGVAGARTDQSDSVGEAIRNSRAQNGAADVLQSQARAAHIRGLKTADAATIVKNNEQSVANITGALTEQYDEAQQHGQFDQMGEAHEALTVLAQSSLYATGKNADTVNKAQTVIEESDKAYDKRLNSVPGMGAKRTQTGTKTVVKTDRDGQPLVDPIATEAAKPGVTVYQREEVPVYAPHPILDRRDQAKAEAEQRASERSSRGTNLNDPRNQAPPDPGATPGAPAP